MIVQLSCCIRPPHYEIDFASEIIRQCRYAGVNQIHDSAGAPPATWSVIIPIAPKKEKPVECSRFLEWNELLFERMSFARIAGGAHRFR
jgi:hypothetical protein